MTSRLTLPEAVRAVYPDRSEEDAWWQTYWDASRDKRAGMLTLLRAANGD